jgi:hypothetical protein
MQQKTWNQFDAHITMRLVEFHRALIARKQIAPISLGQMGVTDGCRYWLNSGLSG